VVYHLRPLDNERAVVAGGSNEARSYAVVAEESASLYSHVRNPDRNRTCCQLLSASSTVQFWPRHAAYLGRSAALKTARASACFLLDDRRVDDLQRTERTAGRKVLRHAFADHVDAGHLAAAASDGQACAVELVSSTVAPS
jgi:hypothetical protein